jgi:hypothetical protein
VCVCVRARLCVCACACVHAGLWHGLRCPRWQKTPSATTSGFSVLAAPLSSTTERRLVANWSVADCSGLDFDCLFVASVCVCVCVGENVCPSP